MVSFTHRELERKNTDNNGIWDYVCRQSVLSMHAKQEKNTLCQGIDPRFTCRSGLKMVTVLTELPWHQLLGYFICFKGKMVTLMREYHVRCVCVFVWVCVCVCVFFLMSRVEPLDRLSRNFGWVLCPCRLHRRHTSWFLTISIGNKSTVEFVRRAGRWCLFL